MIEITEHLQEAIAVTDKNGGITYRNRAFLETFGDVENIKSILKPDDRGVFFTNLINITLKHKQYSNFIRVISNQDTILLSWLHTFSLNTEIVFEIFNLERAHHSITNISNKEYTYLIKYMAQGVAHSIRNPIMSAGGMLHRIKNRLPEESKASIVPYIEIVEKSLYRILNIIANIEVVTNSLPTSLKKINLTETVKKVIETFSNKGINIKAQLAEIELFADPTHISFVIEELLKNAIEATEATKNPRIELKLEKSGNEAVITLKDNGRGMSGDELELITIPFYSTKPGNMGVGITLSKFLIEGYGGYINFESSRGEGTTVTVAIPIEKRSILRREVVDV